MNKVINYRLQLVEYIKSLGLPHVVVEVGVAEGRFSLDLARLGVDKLYLVDNWATSGETGDLASPQKWHDKNFSDAQERLSEFTNVHFLRGMSTTMANLIPDKSVGLVYLDAGHDYQSVYDDLVAFSDKLADNGIMAGHDYLNSAYGVKQAVADFARDRFNVSLIPEDKEEDAGFWFAVER